MFHFFWQLFRPYYRSLFGPRTRRSTQTRNTFMYHIFYVNNIRTWKLLCTLYKNIISIIWPKTMNFVWLELPYILDCYNNGDDSYKDYSRKPVWKTGTGLLTSLNNSQQWEIWLRRKLLLRISYVHSVKGKYCFRNCFFGREDGH